MRSQGVTPGQVLGVLTYALVAWAAADILPPSEHVAYFVPVGLAAGVLLRAPQPAWRWLLPAMWASNVAICLATGSTWAFALVHATGMTLGAAIVGRLLYACAAPPPLLTNSDFRLLVRTALAASALGGATTVLASGTGGDFRPTWFAAGIFHLVSYLVLVPFFMQVRRGTAVAGSLERVLQAAAIILTVSGTFALHNEVGHLAMVAVFPALAWAAMRFDVRESLVQVLVIGVVGGALTVLGYGSFVAIAHQATTADWQLAALQVYLLALVMTVVPFALTVALQSHTAQALRAQARTMELIVDAAPGGRIEVDSEPGRGSEFRIVLPAASHS